MLVGALYNIVDQIFVGNSELGYLGNAATTVVFPLTIIAAAFAWCFGDGTAAYISISQGKNESGQAHRAVGNALVATVVIGLLFVIVGFSFMDQILYGFGASDASIGLARTYFTIILAAMPVYMVANMLGSIIRADGSPAFSMISMCAGAVINMILDPVFIFGFKWGIAGAAWATIIGQFASLIMTVAYLFKTKSFKLKLKSFVPDFKLFGGTVKLGLSTFITQMSIVVISLVCNIVLVKYGAVSAYGTDIPIAVIGIAMKVFTIVISIVVGFVVGAQPILGYNYGARDFKRVRETFKYVAVFTLIVGAVATLLFELCPQAIINIFGKESDLYNEFAVKTFRIFLCLVLVTSAIKVSSVFFQAVGKPARAAVISLSRDIVL
jgi:putative MATE family efflux protein